MTKKKTNYLFLLGLFLTGNLVLSQTERDTIQHLEEVVVTDYSIDEYSNAQKVSVYNDSLLKERVVNPMELLQNESSIYFKENGRGMVASPSFRGTTAQQTSVLWNGIPINSQLLGQSDFNLISLNNFDEVNVRSGGGSVALGSGAIGGSIHLNNKLKFNKKKTSQIINLNYGSFNTLGLNGNFNHSDQKQSFQFNISRNSSDNDFSFEDIINTNGSYVNTSWSLGYANKLNSNNIIALYSLSALNDRNLSSTLTNSATDRYKNSSNNNLLQWTFKKSNLISKTNLVYQNESFQYYTDGTKNIFTGNEANTITIKYEVLYAFSNLKKLKGNVDYSSSFVDGSSINNEKRKTGSGSLLWFHKPKKWFLYESGLRYEKSTYYDSPLLYSLGIKLNPLKKYSLNINYSKNYRIPTFNDLYWNPGGNTSLIPEHSDQMELSQSIKLKNNQFSLALFYNDIKDMIRWVPNANLGYWQPTNTDNVISKGFELSYNYSVQLKKHHFGLGLNYSFTQSQNQKTGSQLSYVPFDVATSTLNYRINNFSLNYTIRYTGDVYIRSDESDFLENYTLQSIRLNYRLGKKIKYIIGVKANNLLDVVYMNVENRPTPGRNYTLNLNIKF